MSTLEVKAIQAPTGYDLQMPAGAIIQVVGGSRVGDLATTSTSFVAQGLTATITPKFASSKILITTLCGFSVPSNDALYFNIERNVGGSGTNLHSHNEGFGGAQSVTYRGCHTLNYLDSPNTTSAITYKLLVRSGGGNTVEVPAWANALQTITLQEVAG